MLIHRKPLVLLTLCSALLSQGWADDGGQITRAAEETDGPSSVGAPLFGLLADDVGRTIHGLVGVPGAATLSSPVALERGVHDLHLAPGQSLAIAGVDSRIGVVDLTVGRATAPQPIEGLSGSVGLIGFAPGGDAAALLSADGSELQVVERLSGEAAMKWQANIALLEPRAVLLNDTATVAVVVTAAGEVYSLRDGAAPQRVFQSAMLGAAAFLPGQAELAVVDQALDTLYLISDLEGSASISVVATELGLTKGTVLLNSSRDGSWVVAAVAGGMKAVKIVLSTGAVETVPLPVRVTRLDQMGAGDVFVMSFVPGEPAWLLVNREAGLRAVFAAPAVSPARRNATERRTR